MSDPQLELDPEVRARIEALLTEHRVVLFMKGSRRFPQCGFSGAVVAALDRQGASYHAVNVLADPALREGIKRYASWPTIPQLYIGGEFIGGCDIVRELEASGELAALLGQP